VSLLGRPAWQAVESASPDQISRENYLPEKMPAPEDITQNEKKKLVNSVSKDADNWLDQGRK
jgi:hypothetical protein